MDGDTIKVTSRSKLYKVRLSSIDAPEINQPFGKESKRKLFNYIHGKSVKIEKIGFDKYGRVIGIVYLDNYDINLEMIKIGYAWVYKKYLKNLSKVKAKKYLQAQKNAFKNKLGLWVDSNQVPPWKWRRIK